jgi:hypothetical protein
MTFFGVPYMKNKRMKREPFSSEQPGDPENDEIVTATTIENSDSLEDVVSALAVHDLHDTSRDSESGSDSDSSSDSEDEIPVRPSGTESSQQESDSEYDSKSDEEESETDDEPVRTVMVNTRYSKLGLNKKPSSNFTIGLNSPDFDENTSFNALPFAKPRPTIASLRDDLDSLSARLKDRLEVASQEAAWEKAKLKTFSSEINTPPPPPPAGKTLPRWKTLEPKVVYVRGESPPPPPPPMPPSSIAAVAQGLGEMENSLLSTFGSLSRHLRRSSECLPPLKSSTNVSTTAQETEQPSRRRLVTPRRVEVGDASAALTGTPDEAGGGMGATSTISSPGHRGPH